MLLTLDILTWMRWVLKEILSCIFLKTSLTCVIEHDKKSSCDEWKLLPYWLAFIVLKGAIQTTEGEMESQPYLAVNPLNYSNDWPGSYA